MTQDSRLKLRDVRSIFRLIGEVRELGSDPGRWRPHMIRRLSRLLRAEIVISSEIHFRKHHGQEKLRVIDIGWGCDLEGNVWQIHTEREDETPDAFWLLAGQPAPAGDLQQPEQLVPVVPAKPLHGGQCFILSQSSCRNAACLMSGRWISLGCTGPAGISLFPRRSIAWSGCCTWSWRGCGGGMRSDTPRTRPPPFPRG
jgi:hypothetical protein